jgi:hypothetical protein
MILNSLNVSRVAALSLFTAFVVFFTSALADASILFGPSFSYQSVKSTDNTGLAGGAQNSSVLGVDGKLGILIEGTVFYIGGLYSYESTTASSTAKVTGAAYGPTVGIFNGAFALLGTYILSADRTYSVSGSDSKISGGTGFRVDMSYVAGLTGSIGVGPQLTYRSIKYTKSTPAGGIENSNTYEESSIYPSIIFWFRF